jgi:hypothetical protein
VLRVTDLYIDRLEILETRAVGLGLALPNIDAPQVDTLGLGAQDAEIGTCGRPSAGPDRALRRQASP